MTAAATPSLPPALAGERFEFDSPAGRLCLYAAGGAQGTPLLLHIINAAASAAEQWPVCEAFANQRPVYALDFPGYGFPIAASTATHRA